MSNQLHIVCFDVPYPVSHGGYVDLFYKITALSNAGVQIHLHCFVNKREEQPFLNQYCASVQYYPRITGSRGFSFRYPYMVFSRRSPNLLRRLLEDDHPILLEGIHCTFLLGDDRLKGRHIVVRAHNVETLYYKSLAKCTSIGLRKLYFLWESKLLRQQEKKAGRTSKILTVTQKDEHYFKEELHCNDCETLPVFVPYTSIESALGIGAFCLYHGNLSIPENEKAALFLVEEVFNDLPFSLVIAGAHPTSKLVKAIARSRNAKLESDPEEQQLSERIKNAQIHILPSYNDTGIKLKLLHALFKGRHCITNRAAIDGTGLEAACHQGNSTASLKSLVIQLFHLPFSEEEIHLRKQLLLKVYNNETNGRRLMQLLHLHYR